MDGGDRAARGRRGDLAALRPAEHRARIELALGERDAGLQRLRTRVAAEPADAVALQMLGICSALAVTGKMETAFVMTICVTIVVACSRAPS